MIQNQLDFILIDKRYRNAITNAKTRKDADCGSDHDPVWKKIHAKLKKKNRRKIKCQDLECKQIKKQRSKPRICINSERNY